MSRRILYPGTLALIAALYACGDDSKASRQNGAGEGGEDSSAAGAATAGTPSAGGQGGSTTEPQGGGGAVSLGGDDAGGAGGSGGEVDPQAVRGRVIDFWGHELPNVAVQIGDTLTATDENGEFSIPDVSEAYDVSLLVEIDDNTRWTYAWVYQGLTRRDPTLQIERGLRWRQARAELKLAAPVTVGDNQSIVYSVGSPHGHDTDTLDYDPYVPYCSWVGPSDASGDVQALHYQYDVATELPTTYLAYDLAPIELTESENSEPVTSVELDLAAENLATSTLRGSVTPQQGVSRSNSVYLHSSGGSILPLVEESGASDLFSYLVPSLPETTFTVTASEGDPQTGAYAVARASGLVGTDEPELVIPEPVRQVSPMDEAATTSETEFVIDPGDDNAGPFVYMFENWDESQDAVYQTLYVVTQATTLKLPTVLGGGFALQSGKTMGWRVATHGSYPTVDDVADADGFLQPFSVHNAVPYGERQESGEYTLSTGRYFYTPALGSGGGATD